MTIGTPIIIIGLLPFIAGCILLTSPFLMYLYWAIGNILSLPPLNCGTACPETIQGFYLAHMDLVSLGVLLFLASLPLLYKGMTIHKREKQDIDLLINKLLALDKANSFSRKLVQSMSKRNINYQINKLLEKQPSEAYGLSEHQECATCSRNISKQVNEDYRGICTSCYYKLAGRSSCMRAVMIWISSIFLLWLVFSISLGWLAWIVPFPLFAGFILLLRGCYFLKKIEKLDKFKPRTRNF